MSNPLGRIGRSFADRRLPATIEEVAGDHNRSGPLVLTLVKKEHRWLVRDVDFETPDSAEEERKRFLDKHPDANPLADSTTKK
jgi:hypothetical protein